MRTKDGDGVVAPPGPLSGPHFFCCIFVVARVVMYFNTPGCKQDGRSEERQDKNRATGNGGGLEAFFFQGGVCGAVGRELPCCTARLTRCNTAVYKEGEATTTSFCFAGFLFPLLVYYVY